MGFFDWLGKLLGGDTSYEPGARSRRMALDQRERQQKRATRRHVRRHTSSPEKDAARMRELGVPALHKDAELAAALGIDENELDWLADRKRRMARSFPHYRLLARPKRNGIRVLLAPRPKLKRVQRWILENILDRVPVHDCAHGFIGLRSIRTNATPHIGREVLCQVDIANFFHQFTYRRVVGLFHSFGYPLLVARKLALLTTASQEGLGRLAKEAGVDVAMARKGLEVGLRKAHHPVLPQGAPTSPAIANHLCRRLDRRMQGLAQRFDAHYTRYADDLTFSGDRTFRRDLRRFVPLVRRILREERLPMEPSKLRFARKGARQVVCGIVVNTKLNTKSNDYRRLRATLHNCAKHGPETQNRSGRADFRAHLEGRIAWHASVNPERGARLRRQFEGIAW